MSPWKCPATFSIISYIEHGSGIHHPIGGLVAISEAMAKVVGEEGGRIHLSTAIEQILVRAGRAVGVRLQDGSEVAADHMVVNADFGYAMSQRGWIRRPDGQVICLMVQPGTLLPAVTEYVKVVTDERGTCRRTDAAGRCVEDDYVFSTDEQYYHVVDTDERVVPFEVQAGHVEIVGTEGLVPTKLIALLQERGILACTPPERRAEIAQLLRRLY